MKNNLNGVNEGVYNFLENDFPRYLEVQKLIKFIK